MTYNAYSVMDIRSYCEVATDSVQKAVDAGDYDSASVRLCAYLLEVRERYLSGEIKADTWRGTLRFYRRMTAVINEEISIQQTIADKEKEIRQ